LNDIAVKHSTVRLAGPAQGLTLVALGTLPTLALAGLVPVLPLFLQRFHAIAHADWYVPMVLTVPSVCVALLSGPIGYASDCWGRRRLLLSALAAFGLFGLAPLLFSGLFAIIASRVAVGVAEAAILTLGNALMGDYFDGHARHRWLSLQVSIGPFVGSGFLLAGGALGGWRWNGPFLLYLFGFAVLLVCVFTLYEPARAAHAAPAEPPEVQPGAFPWLVALQVGAVTLLVAVIYFVQAVQHGRIFNDLGVLSPERISWVVTLASMGTVLGGLYYGWAGDRPITTLLAWVFTGFGVCYLALSWVPDWRSGVLFDALGQFAGGMAIPALIAWALSRYPFAHRGRGMGLWGACFFLGQFLSPPVLSLIAHGQLNFLRSVGVLGGVSLVCALAAVLIGRRTRVRRPAVSGVGL